MNKPVSRVLLMAGGTGGHVFPALATARYLESQGVTTHWLGTRAGIEARLIPEAGISITYLDVAGVRGQGVKRLLLAPFRIAKAVIAAVRFIREFKPDYVVGMGGFVTGPGGVAAWLSGVPLFIHEQNAIPGFTNRMLSRIARRVYQAFPDTFAPSEMVVTTGNPVRAEISALPAPAERFAGREGKIRLLVLGGSQGAVALNKTLPEALALLKHPDRYEIVHQSGPKDFEATANRYRSLAVSSEVKPFINDMAAAYGSADVVICRSGALTVSELAAAGVGALLIPYPFAVDDHQTSNAGYLVDHNAGLLVQQSQLTPAMLADLIETRLSDRQALLDMAIRSRSLAQNDATRKLVEGCAEAL